MKTPIKNSIVEFITALFVLLFVYTGISKLSGHSLFFDQLNFIFHHQGIASILSFAIPVSELIIAALLCFEGSRLYGLYTSVAIMMLFTGYIIYLLSTGRPLPCSCGGVISSLTWTEHIIFNICFLLLGIAGICIHKTPAYPAYEKNTHKYF